MAVSPGTYNMTIQRRSDHSVEVTLKDKNGGNIDLTGYSLASQIWDSGRSTKAADATVSVTSASNGAFTWSLTDTQTTTLTADEYKYDVLLTSPAGLKNYWLEGTIYMDQGFTTA